jgi:hypothetical protein
MTDFDICSSKFPTISKIPPTPDEVDGFISLVDRLREEQKERAATECWGEHCIGVHCHYGKFIKSLTSYIFSTYPRVVLNTPEVC